MIFGEKKDKLRPKYRAVSEFSKKVPVLFVREDSIYKKLPGFDPFDRIRDARTYTGDQPVIAHPPCATWGRLRKLSKQKTHDLGIFAVDLVHRVGGVIEHPAGSKLFELCDMSIGFILSVNQSWFGHPASKRTWLYIAHADLCRIPPHPLSFDLVTKKVDRMSVRMREHTPKAFALYLREIALVSGPVPQEAVPPSEAMGA